MPELAEVEYYRKQWSPGVGQGVRKLYLHTEKRIFREIDIDSMVEGIEGTRLMQSATSGKQLYFVFGTQHWLGLHLGMTGALSAVAGVHAIGKHDHLVFEMESGLSLVFTDPRLFGRVRYSRTDGCPDWLTGLPPEILSNEFTLEMMNAFLKRRSKAPIKAVLLMQERFPGVGNWMADEVLWRAGIDPNLAAGRIGPQKCIQLFDTLREVCADALRVIGSDWSDPPDDWLFNHRWKDGRRCPRTGSALRREKIGGRTTCWSPAWQTYRGR